MSDRGSKTTLLLAASVGNVSTDCGGSAPASSLLSLGFAFFFVVRFLGAVASAS